MGGQAISTIYIQNINIGLPLSEVKRRLTNLLLRLDGYKKVMMGGPGQAYAKFGSRAQAEAGIRALDGLVQLGRAISVGFARADMRAGFGPAGSARESEGAASKASGGAAEALPAGTKMLILKGVSNTTLLPQSILSDATVKCRPVKCKNLIFLDFAIARECKAFYERMHGEVEVNDATLKLEPNKPSV